jgi:hypothetical protein
MIRKRLFSHAELIDFNGKYFALKTVPKLLLEKHQVIGNVITEIYHMIRC